MPKYKCQNPTCNLYNQIRTEKSILMFVKDRIVDSAESCPVCNEPRVCLHEEGMPTAFHGSDNICKH